jgi:CPA1 family monovalent cation:H+ antiporter
MEIVYTVLILLLVVALSGALLRLLPFRLPLPLVQIGLGALLALPVFGLHVDFDHELFFLLFVPPLLFADGWRIPKREFFLLRGPILTMATGLVLFTIVGVGYFVHWMIPGVPLAVAFALAAVLSPTDALAIGSITGRGTMPPRLMHVLEGEALMNDASGLVALQFAVAAVLTGHFSAGDAAFRFLFMAVGGVLVGAGVTWLFSRVRRRLLRWGADADPASQIALLLLLPFAAYLLAERVHVSGILAAVVAGMMMNIVDVMKGSHVSVRMQNVSVWSMVEFVFNGIIFLLLGLQLPRILGNARIDLVQAGGGELWHLPAYVLAITLALILLRFVWVWVSLRFVWLRASRRAQPQAKLSKRLIWAAAMAGVRGAITLAGVLSVPLLLGDGSPFPARDLIVFLATGVILATLILGSISLPLLLKNLRLPVEDPRVREERLARGLVAEAAIRGTTEAQSRMEVGQDEAGVALVARAAARVVADYQQRLEAAGDDGELPAQARRESETGRALRLAAVRAERGALDKLRKSRRINDETMRLLAREIDLAEASFVEPGMH